MTDTEQTTQLAIFRTLKPACVALSDNALKVLAGKASPNSVVPSVENLLNLLRNVLRNASKIDDRLVNYIFFPLSHLFKEKDKFTTQSLELAIQCLELLLQTGWRNISDPNLALQLLILLTLFADPEQRSVSTDIAATSEDLILSALKCLSELFLSLRDCQACKNLLADTPNLPVVGHSVTVILENLKSHKSKDGQIAAAAALEQLCIHVAKNELLTNFLPGIFSTLSYVLLPSTRIRRPYVALEKGLSILAYMIGSSLSDENLSIQEQLSPGNTRSDDHDTKFEPTSWFKATAAQTKLVLANVSKLRDHERTSVRLALLHLCWIVLERCRTTLSDAIPMIFETTTTLISKTDDSGGEFRMERLIAQNNSIVETARNLVYESSTSLPRIMSSNDEDAMTSQVEAMNTTIQMLHHSGNSNAFIDEVLQLSILDSLSMILDDTNAVQNIPTDLVLEQPSIKFVEVDEHLDRNLWLTGNKSQDIRLEKIKMLLETLSVGGNALTIARNALSQVYDEKSRLANLWICFIILETRLHHSDEFSQFLELDSSSEQDAAARDELYAIAIDILSKSSQIGNSDWRIQAMTLEILASSAQERMQSFRPELVDVLYPVVQLLGSPIQNLRYLAMNCLNVIASSCKYSGTKDMIVSNVDYLVNAIGIRLNALDISPQLPQVLLMMIKLCGPSLLPYIEDLVGNIFEALECFHGYPLLVEQLFSVLNAAVEEGVKTSPFKVGNSEAQTKRKLIRAPQGIRGLLDQVRERHGPGNSDRDSAEYIEVPDFPLETPRRPWKELKSKIDPSNAQEDDDSSEEHVTDEPDVSDAKDENGPKVSATYKMLQNISRETQHHLPSSSPSVRMSLLSLLARAIPFLANSDDEFLPLIHTLWPVLTPRLEDKEAFVVAGVLNVMGRMSEASGDFISSRIENLLPALRRVFARCNDSTAYLKATDTNRGKSDPIQVDKHRPASNTQTSIVTSPPSSRSERDLDSTAALVVSPAPKTSDSTHRYMYTSTSARTIREAFTDFLVQVLLHVNVSENTYDEFLHEMLYDELVFQQRKDVLEALSVVNPDAVWLVLQEAAWKVDRPTADEDYVSTVFGVDAPVDVPDGPRLEKKQSSTTVQAASIFLSSPLNLKSDAKEFSEGLRTVREQFKSLSAYDSWGKSLIKRPT